MANPARPAPLPHDALERALDPGGSGCMLPQEAYTSEAVLAWEREHLFAAGWVCAGRATDLVEPGARRAVRIGDDAIVVVRGDDGNVRAFFNVCRHRGHELMPCGTTANRAAIHCPYHGWTYAPDGRLRATPRFDPPPDFDPSDFGLVGVRAEEWHGWVMVNVSGDAVPLARWIGGLEELIAPYGCEELVVGASHDYLLAANWKLPIENYHECYHCPTIHPELCTVSPPASGDNYDLPGAWFGGTMDLAAHAETMSMSGKSPAGFLPGLDATRRRQVLYAGIFPNLLLSLHPDYVMTHRIEPRSARYVLGRVPVAVHRRHRCARRFRSRLRSRLLARHERSGLERLRRRPARGDVARLPTGTVLAGRRRGAGVRSLRCPCVSTRRAPAPLNGSAIIGRGRTRAPSRSATRPRTCSRSRCR